ncbi:MAG: ATP-binding protein [Pirellulales bacterium]
MPGSEIHLLLPYVTDLEFEVDRLRRQGRFIEQRAWDALKQVQKLCGDATQSQDTADALAQIEKTANEFAKVLGDLHEQPGYHPAHDQVIPIAARPLIEQVFRWQQRLSDASQVVLRLELEIEHLDWFPARFRHIVDNLLANALKYRGADKGETRVTLALRRSPNSYELRISDNGVGIQADARIDVLELFYRAAPMRAAGLGVGLAVVKLLVEQSGGTLTVESVEGQGTSFLAVLPRYDIDDFLK